jgi:hypothetical protein
MGLLGKVIGIYMVGMAGTFSYGMYGIKVDEAKHKIEGTRRDRSGDIAVPVSALVWPVMLRHSINVFLFKKN